MCNDKFVEHWRQAAALLAQAKKDVMQDASTDDACGLVVDLFVRLHDYLKKVTALFTVAHQQAESRKTITQLKEAIAKAQAELDAILGSTSGAAKAAQARRLRKAMLDDGVRLTLPQVEWLIGRVNGDDKKALEIVQSLPAAKRAHGLLSGELHFADLDRSVLTTAAVRSVRDAHKGPDMKALVKEVEAKDLGGAPAGPVPSCPGCDSKMQQLSGVPMSYGGAANCDECGDRIVDEDGMQCGDHFFHCASCRSDLCVDCAVEYMEEEDDDDDGPSSAAVKAAGEEGGEEVPPMTQTEESLLRWILKMCTWFEQRRKTAPLEDRVQTTVRQVRDHELC